MAHAPPETQAIQAPALFKLRLGAFWRFLRTQPPSFWLINLYLLIEYVRPQVIWRWLDILPWGQTSLLAALVALVLEGKLPRFRTVAGPLLLLFSGVLVLSSVFAQQPSAAFAAWEVYFSWVLVVLLITNTVTTEKRLFVFVLAFLLYSFKLSQHGSRVWAASGFSFARDGVMGPAGWFYNSGELGIQMCVLLPLSVEFILGLRHYWQWWKRAVAYVVPLTAVGTAIATSSRGALVGIGAVAFWWILRSKKRFRTIVGVAVLALGVWTMMPSEFKARFDTAGEDSTSQIRLERWEAGLEMAREHPALGIGYANWRVYYGGLSHNIFIEAMAELGYTGLLAFISLIAATFWLNARTRSILVKIPKQTSFLRHTAYGLDGALIGFIASGFFVTVLYYPYFWINLAMTVSLHVIARKQERSFSSRRSGHGRYGSGEWGRPQMVGPQTLMGTSRAAGSPLD